MRLLFRGYYFLHDGILSLLSKLDGVAPFLIRLYLSPIMLAAGLYKLEHFDATASWLGQGLHLPYPELMAYLVTYTELVGGFLLLFGLAVRWVSIPLMVAMLVAAYSVHWDNGWFAIAPSDPLTSAAKPLADIGLPMAKESMENSIGVGERLGRARALLNEYGHYGWLTEKGNYAVLNNGIEFAATYFIMLLSLLFSGGGRYLSLDYFLDRQVRQYMKPIPIDTKMEPELEPAKSGAESAKKAEVQPEKLSETPPKDKSEAAVETAVDTKPSSQESQAGTEVKE
ncbi:HvfX family Cu-binding RiPP maturation protein [Zhongshania sp. BJYM1]|uniref:HvfX family Cu-binding RiPP maturation protein n=1 Tax=Zhongshania aquatica TaxID=2965069 RepID=UPI002F968D10